AWPMWARILLAWVVFTPLAWGAVFLAGGRVVTVMASVILYLAVLAVLLTLRFRSGRWRRVALVEP
ncbi:MAG: hypothetical protein FJ104_12465, partial [Deltaproteobacteria bacterium]|nr:hypothetical protein [Deltaproteobacteria bacterium]